MMKTNRLLPLLVLSLFGLVAPTIGVAQTGANPTVSPAIDGIIAIFRDHPLVGLGDYHGLAQEEDFYAALIRDPRFAQEVGNVILETGEASSQPVIDRYVNGENVPYEDLRKVWSNPVGWIPTVTALGLINVYATIRDVNSKLPVGQRIHVWLGDPPIDWTKMHSRSDVDPILRQRDSYPASLIEQEILQKGKKALVIYGTFHFFGSQGLWGLVSQSHPGAFIRVTPYTGYVEKNCSEDFESQIAGWPLPALATPVQGTTLATQLKKADCHFNPPGALDGVLLKAPTQWYCSILRTISRVQAQKRCYAARSRR
jgi:hypothetical protein